MLLIASAGLFSCTKSKNTHTGSNGNYSCYCSWVSSAQKDTTTTFYYPADTTRTNAQAACDFRLLWVQSISGTNSGAYCTFN